MPCMQRSIETLEKRTDLFAEQTPGGARDSTQAKDDPLHRPHQLLPVELAGDLQHAAIGLS